MGFGGVSDLPQVLTWQVSPALCGYALLPFPLTTVMPLITVVRGKWGGSALRGFPAAYVGGRITGKDATSSCADEHNRQLFLHDLQNQLDCCLL